MVPIIETERLKLRAHRMEDFREHPYGIDNAGGRAADGIIVK